MKLKDEQYEQYRGIVFRFAMQMTGSTSIAEDVAQEVFLFLMQNPKSYDPDRGSLTAFLLGVARNFTLQMLRKQTTLEGLGEEEDAAGSTPLSELLHDERMARMKRAILSLPEDYREVIVLCELSELSYEQAAGVL